MPSLKSPTGNTRAERRLRRRHARAGTHGFTLLELLIALAILSVGLTVLLAIFSQGLQRSRDDQTEATARAFAASLLSQSLAGPEAEFGETGRAPTAMSGASAWSPMEHRTTKTPGTAARRKFW